MRRVKHPPKGAIRYEAMRVLHDMQGGKCAICGGAMPHPDEARVRRGAGEVQPHVEDPSLEHVVPRGRGGTNKLTNLVLAHCGCNNERGDGDLSERARLVWRANLIALAVIRGERLPPAACGVCPLPHACESRQRCEAAERVAA